MKYSHYKQLFVFLLGTPKLSTQNVSHEKVRIALNCGRGEGEGDRPLASSIYHCVPISTTFLALSEFIIATVKRSLLQAKVTLWLSCLYRNPPRPWRFPRTRNPMINILAPELFFLILAHTVYKM
jgi:hypothetical protein